MEPWILMLRGVNVSGANRLPMAAFRAMLEGLGLGRVQTYIQSGNAVFLGEGGGLEARISDGLRAGFGLEVPVFLLRLDAMAAAVAGNPFEEPDGARVHLVFLAPEARLEPGLEAHCTAGERFHLGQGVLYLHTPQGFGTSKAAEKLGRYLKGPITARNQRSARAILDLAQGLTGT